MGPERYQSHYMYNEQFYSATRMELEYLELRDP